MKTGRTGRHLLPADIGLRRQHERPARGNLGAVVHGDPNQVFEILVGIDQGDLQVIVLHRDNNRAWVEAEDLGEIGAVEAPQFTGGGSLLLEVREDVPGPIDLVSRDKVFAHLQDAFDQPVAPLDGVEGAGIHSPILVYQEVGVGGLKQDVVLRGLDIELARIEGLPRGQRLEDDVREIHVLPEAGPRVVEVCAVDGHDTFIEIRAAAVVPDIIGANHEHRDPENLGPRELRFGDPYTGLRGRHDQRPSIAQSEGGREVDGQADVRGFESADFILRASASGDAGIVVE